MKHEVAREDGVHVCAEKCATCIFRPGNLMSLHRGRVKSMVKEAVENQSCIPCHKTIFGEEKPAICRGFFDSYGHQVWALRLAQGMDAIVYDPVPE